MTPIIQKPKQRQGGNMQRPYKLIVWGLGRMGNICIWETTQSPAFELVGVRTYNEAKEGQDAGELIGIEPLGIKATANVDALLALECDCIVMTARDRGTFHTDDEILRLLAAGKNVVTVLPYQNAHLSRDEVFVQKLKDACKQGKSVFHASGIDPDLISDRILLGLTGACADIKSIKLQEMWDCSFAEEGPLKYIGFGLPPEVGQKNTVTQVIPKNFLMAILRTVEHQLGVKYDRVVATHDYITTPVAIEKPFLIPAGTVGRAVHRVEGFVDAIGPEPFFTMEYNWLIGDTMLPEGVHPGQYYLAKIEGRPSLTMTLDFKASHQNDDRYYEIGNMKVEPSYVATVVPCMQAIPHICAAEPGILPSFGPSLHWMQDLRESARRASLVHN
jgi:2,4-diaminopentanoate dehydrogenase